MFSQNGEYGLIGRVQGSIHHGNTDAELNVEPMAQINVAKLTTFGSLAMGLCDLLAGRQEVSA